MNVEFGMRNVENEQAEFPNYTLSAFRIPTSEL